jgi:peroxiredoxin
MPGFIKLCDAIKDKGINDILCLSVNDKFVMQSWLSSYYDGNKIKAIADGNAEITKTLNLSEDKSKNYMGLRCVRFAMLVNNNSIEKLFIDKPGKYELSSAEHILSII